LRGLIRAAGIVAVSLALLGASSAQALTLQRVGGNFDQPTYVTSDPGDAGRLFVVEREGTIELVEGGVTSEFADLSSAVDCAGGCQGERGLMSIALAPDFDSSGRLYVDYANNVDGTIHIDELTADADGKHAQLSSLRPLLSIPHPTESNHNGGQVQFGPDGDLYISTGDGGGGNDKFHNAQNLQKPLGKILRIHPNPDGPAPFYTVPAGNPFAAIAGDYAPIWSYGLRNPFRFSFDSLSGDMVIGDVGEGTREEIDFAPSPLADIVGGGGADYGWNCREGLVAGPTSDPECATPPAGGFTDPVFDYSHTAPPGGTAPCAIIGGYVVRDHSLGDLYGRYLYGDLCTGELRSVDLANPLSSDRSEGIEMTNLNSFGEDSCGRIYAVEGGGHVYRLTSSTPATCPPPAQLAPQPVTTAKPAGPTFVGIKAQRRRVERGKRAVLTVFVSPCDRRKGAVIGLLRNGHPNGTRRLSRACTARFVPLIRGGTHFTAIVHAERGYVAGRSRQLTIRLAHRKRRP
jgi:glucose/arabinose dehydrogenase